MSYTLWSGATMDVPFSVAKLDLRTGLPVDVTQAASPRIGFVAAADGGQVAPVTWYAASWLANTARQLYWLSALLGPGGVYNIPVGLWVPWANFVLNEETVIRPCNDTLTVAA